MDSWGWVIFFVIFVLVAMAIYGTAESDCSAKGGTLVQGVIGWACVDTPDEK